MQFLMTKKILRGGGSTHKGNAQKDTAGYGV